jgi:hypothetical protein
MTSTQNAPASARQQLVEVAEFPGYFANKTGGEVTAESTAVWDGGNRKPEQMSGPSATSNVVVSRPYRPAVHGPILRRMAKQVGQLRTTVSVWDTDPDLGPIGEPVVYANALLVRMRRPEADAASSSASTLELEFAVEEEA